MAEELNKLLYATVIPSFSSKTDFQEGLCSFERNYGFPFGIKIEEKGVRDMEVRPCFRDAGISRSKNHIEIVSPACLEGALIACNPGFFGNDRDALCGACYHEIVHIEELVKVAAELNERVYQIDLWQTDNSAWNPHVSHSLAFEWFKDKTRERDVDLRVIELGFGHYLLACRKLIESRVGINNNYLSSSEIEKKIKMV